MKLNWYSYDSCFIIHKLYYHLETFLDKILFISVPIKQSLIREQRTTNNKSSNKTSTDNIVNVKKGQDWNRYFSIALIKIEKKKKTTRAQT